MENQKQKNKELVGCQNQSYPQSLPIVRVLSFQQTQLQKTQTTPQTQKQHIRQPPCTSNTSRHRSSTASTTQKDFPWWLVFVLGAIVVAIVIGAVYYYYLHKTTHIKLHSELPNHQLKRNLTNNRFGCHSISKGRCIKWLKDKYQTGIEYESKSQFRDGKKHSAVKKTNIFGASNLIQRVDDGDVFLKTKTQGKREQPLMRGRDSKEIDLRYLRIHNHYPLVE